LQQDCTQERRTSMKRWLPALFLTLGCAVSPATAPVQAGTGIQRCQDSGGATLYTDKPCRALGARPVPLPAELATRIVRERSHEQALSTAAFDTRAGAMETLVYADASAPLSLASSPPAPARRSVAAGCARTPTQLQMDLRGAFALGDVNRIAESYHWVGVSHRGAMRILDRLQSMARRQVADAEYFNASITSGDGMYASAGDSAIGGSGGILQLTFAGADGGSIADLDVERYRGCYFVRF
jgi:hypothetical protein